ncbi:MAG: peptidoglycan editing factor PgeF [Bacteroidales bacterium]|nr:peptidoglycan editing factor PgeF [Bacteroidales bacterium]
MLQYKETPLPYFEWLNTNTCIAGFSTRKGGVSQGVYNSMNTGLHSEDKQENIKKNRHLLFNAIAPSLTVSNLRQVHSAKIVEVDDSFVNDSEADGFFTRRKGVMLSISIADCGSILFHDEDFSIIAGLHCGWRGTRDGIIQNMVKILSQYVEPQKIHAYIGPMISGENYEVGKEFLNYFPNDFFSEKNNSLYFNLNKTVESTLQNLNIGTIHNANLDTYSNPELFFSYRRDGKTGRMCSFIGLK